MASCPLNLQSQKRSFVKRNSSAGVHAAVGVRMTGRKRACNRGTAEIRVHGVWVVLEQKPDKRSRVHIVNRPAPLHQRLGVPTAHLDPAQSRGGAPAPRAGGLSRPARRGAAMLPRRAGRPAGRARLFHRTPADPRVKRRRGIVHEVIV